jgi:rhodanese-related sulfurtransferase
MKDSAIRKLAFVIILLAVAGPSATRATSVDSSPNCGIYALYTAIKIEGGHADLSSLLRPEYISTKEGSTLIDLQRAAQDRGMYARVLSNLTIANLRRAGSPMILHVKNEYDAPTYSHFILCVPGRNGRIALYDAPQEVIWTTGEDLAPLWDGTALTISTHPIHLTAGSEDLWNWGLLAAVTISVTAASRRLRIVKQSALNCGVVIQAGVIACIAGIFAVAQHRISQQGFQSQRAAVTAIQSAIFQPSCPPVNVAELQSLMGRGAYVVDARTPSDFQQGHIGKAVNVPANAPRQARIGAMGDVPKDAMVIVYCESSACPFAPFIARRLTSDGFSSVRVFPGGWEAWNASETHRQKEIQ